MLHWFFRGIAVAWVGGESRGESDGLEGSKESLRLLKEVPGARGDRLLALRLVPGSSSVWVSRCVEAPVWPVFVLRSGEVW